MPVRDVETFVPARTESVRVLSNRGANGIDGTIAAALGAAAAGDGPVVLLIGDVAFAYDATALISARRLEVPLTVVLVDNDGGGIFHFLPIAGEADVFESQIATPHGLDFAALATGLGATHEAVGDPPALRSAVAASLVTPGVQVIEVRTDRRHNVAVHRAAWDAVSAALAAARS
jgi:2-succinyl-5-enolpyruvyl-6-hydroxy-3-cyclohexene-1-carboxylate synthase